MEEEDEKVREICRTATEHAGGYCAPRKDRSNRCVPTRCVPTLRAQTVVANMFDIYMVCDESKIQRVLN